MPRYTSVKPTATTTATSNRMNLSWAKEIESVRFQIPFGSELSTTRADDPYLNTASD